MITAPVLSEEKPGNLRLGLAEFDLETRVLSGPRGQVRLSPIMYAIMARLSRRPGVIVLDTDMISSVWPDPDSEPENPDQTIRTSIKCLRGILEGLGTGGMRKVSIMREAGVGYFLDVRAKK